MPSSAHCTIPPPLGKLGAGHRVPAPNAARLVYRPSGRSQEITSGTLVPGGRPEFGSEVVAPTAMADEYGAQFIFLCASAETPPRCDATLLGVTRPTRILVPRVRQAPHRRTSCGTQSPDISRIPRRLRLAPSLPLLQS